jgi:hypothetical protein
METKLIKSSNKKFLLSIIGSLLFIFLGGWLAINPDKFVSTIFKNLFFIRTAGIVALLFFGFILLTIIKKRLSDKNMGIIINELGIIDNSSFVSVGLIKWEDIISIEKSNVLSTKFLLIKVKNPEYYINISTGIKSKLLNGNYKSYGTPISISSNFISCSFSQLEDILSNSFEKYKMNN